MKRCLLLITFALTLLVPGAAGAHAQAAPPPPPASVYTSDTHPECSVVPVPGVDGVFTVDTIEVLGVQLPGTNSTGGPKCDPAAWTPAIVFLRGLGNAGIGLSLRDVYLQGISVPKYVLVAAEACSDERGFNCGYFSVLVPGQRSGEHWNAATAAAHSLQKSKPPTGQTTKTYGTWEFMGEEPQPVSDACLKALPLDPCWGSGYVDYSQPITPLAPSAISATTRSTQRPTAVPAPRAGGPSIVPVAVAPGHELDYLYLFVGEWGAHENSLEVRPDGTATWTSAPIGGGDVPASSTELQFVLTNGGEVNALATVQVVATSDTTSLLQVGETGTFILRRMDSVIVPTFGNDDFFPFCANDSSPNPWCGA